MSDPKIVFLDIETVPIMREVWEFFPQLSDYPGQTLKASINSVLCVGYRILGEKVTKSINTWDFPEWEHTVNDDRPTLKAISEILKDADAVVTHNGKRFDWKFLQTRMLIQKLPFLEKIAHVDTCSIAKGNLYLFNNRLNTLAQATCHQKKLENGGWKLWVKCGRDKDPKALELMAKYCRKDVSLLEPIFKRLRPLIKNIPNHNLFQVAQGEKHCCPNCGSTKLKSEGTRVKGLKLYRRLYCQSCGSPAHAMISNNKSIPRPI